MNIPKDVYEYLANFADDKTILNMLAVNKKFNDPIFFERIMKRKYPLLLKMKPRKMDFKHFFLTMIHYIAKLEEEYKLPYLPSERFDPERFYDIVKEYEYEGEDFWALALPFAASSGRQDLVDYVMKMGKLTNPRFFELGLFDAASSGKLNIVKFMVSKGAKDFDSAIVAAGRENHIDVVQFLIEKGARNFNETLEDAASEGNIDIVKLMVKMGATNIKESLERAEEASQRKENKKLDKSARFLDTINYLKKL